MNQFAGFLESSAGAGARTPARKRNDLRESQKCSPGRATGAQRSNESTRGGAEGVGPDSFSFFDRISGFLDKINRMHSFALKSKLPQASLRPFQFLTANPGKP